jgi:hypothetical protein
MKAGILILAGCLSLLPVLAEGAGPVTVVKLYVACTTDDVLGQRLCSALKEKIRASRGFELVDFREAQHDPKGFAIHIVSMDVTDIPGESGLRTTLAIVFTVPLESGEELYQTVRVVEVGKYHIDDEASDLLAEIDQQTEYLQH